jgi:hypothetical protein
MARLKKLSIQTKRGKKQPRVPFVFYILVFDGALTKEAFLQDKQNYM